MGPLAVKIVHATRDGRDARFFGGTSRSDWIIISLQALLVAASGFAALKGIADFFGITEHGILSPNSLLQLLFAIFVVVVLTLAMWASIEWAATRTHSLASRIVLFGLYLTLLVWSVGFGYGFWWSVLAASNETNTAITKWVSKFKNNIADANGQLDGLVLQTDLLRAEAVRLKEDEEKVGGTCGRNDGGGCKALCNTRIRITTKLEGITATMKDDWLKRLQSDLGKFGSGVRQEIESLNGKSEYEQRRGLIDIRERGNAEETGFNSFSQQRAHALSAELEAVADPLRIPPTNPSKFTCYNPEQAASIERVIAALKQPPELKISNFDIFLGTDATRVAILKLWRFVASSITGYELAFMRPTGFEEAGGSAVLRGDDWIALMATCLVDLAILIFAWFKPRPAFPSHAAARKWLDEKLGGHENDFVSWYTQYQLDRRGSLYIVRPTQFWARVGKSRDGELSVDQFQMVALALVEKKLIKEIRPDKQLLTTAQQVLQNKSWTVQTPDSPATVYRVIGSGMAQLYAAARGEADRRTYSFFRSSGSRKTSSSADRGPGQ